MREFKMNMIYNLENIKCSIIVVFYEGEDNFRNCLRSIADHCSSGTEVIVVNNSSEPCNCQDINIYPLKIIDHRQNVGFGRGVNIGLQAASGKYIVLLNPDAELTDNFISEAMSLLSEKEEIAAVGAKLIDPSGKQEPSAQRFPTTASFFLEIFKMGYFRKDTMALLPSFTYHQKRYYVVDWLCGAAAVLRRKSLEQIGGFDEDYFLYYEDVDLFKRLKKENYQIVYSDEFVVKHLSRNENDLYCKKFDSRIRIISNTNSALIYWSKNDKKNIDLIRFTIVVNYILRILIWFFLPILKPQITRDQVSQRIQGYICSIMIALFK